MCTYLRLIADQKMNKSVQPNPGDGKISPGPPGPDLDFLVSPSRNDDTDIDTRSC
jgi:hypothetical protein